MNFTREPIIETIITPKDGFRLTVRSSKGQSLEEYSVEALEVVSFGHAHFFRSLEKPKSFLLPITDYEVVETRETKIVLKNPQIDKTIKIAGGKEPHQKPHVKETQPSDQTEYAVDSQEEEKEVIFEKRKDKKKNRRKKAQEHRQLEKETENKADEKSQEAVVHRKETTEDISLTAPLFSSLLPPPTTLISETIGRYKAMESSENFMNVKGQSKDQTEVVQESETSDVADIAHSNEDELDEIWAHKQSEETFSFVESTQPEVVGSDIEEEETTSVEATEEASLDEEKPLEMDVDKFIE